MAEVEQRAERQVRAYIDHLEDAEYCRAVFALADLPTICTVLVKMLQSGERSAINDALLFMCDVVNYRMLAEFTRYLPQSIIVPALRDLLYASDQNVRHNAIHTIGKMGPRQHARMLAEAFPQYLERYPLELPDLLYELFWLSREEGQRRWEYYDQVAASSSYLFRWAVLEMTHHDVSTDLESASSQRLERLYAALSNDDNALVSTEAAHQLSRLRLNSEAPALPRAEWQSRKKQLHHSEPALTFAKFKFNFWNYLSAADHADYDAPTLDAFARYCLHHPMKAQTDRDEYARAFEKWRGRNGDTVT